MLPGETGCYDLLQTTFEDEAECYEVKLMINYRRYGILRVD